MQVHAGCLVGVEAYPVMVEARIVPGLPAFDVVGLPERGVRESRVRVKSALGAQGYEFPSRKVVVNLAPGDLRKTGASYDLAVAVALLEAAGRLAAEHLADTLILGELSLTGALRPIRGVLPQLRSAARRGLRRAIVPAANAEEAALVSSLDVRLASTLRDVVEHLEGTCALPPPSTPAFAPGPCAHDLADVRGQATVRRALEIAAAGRHHLLLIGPPGAGKTMMARRLPGVMPTPDEAECLAIATIASAAGLPLPGPGTRPFRAPHHTASAAAMVGGGDPVHPGEVTLAHGGVLFLDELPEFRRDVIETLRTTMETGHIDIARARQRVRMPADPLVVAAMNPCPCGYAGDPERACLCGADRIERYVARISGPLLDRFDLHVRVPRVPPRDLRSGPRTEPTSRVRERVEQARALRAACPRSGGLDAVLEGVEPPALELLDRAVEALKLSARAYVKAIRVGRTIAALAGRDRVQPADLAEAVQYRQLDTTGA